MNYMDLLPHQLPFRLVEKVDTYQPSKLLRTTLNTQKLYWLDNKEEVPYSIMLEGVAQTAVIFIQLETKPLQKNEFPVLGSVKSDYIQKAPLYGGMLSFEVKPLRIHDKQAILEGKVTSNNIIIMGCILTVGVQK